MHLIVVALLLVAGGIFGSGAWAVHTENSCWKEEARLALQKYGTLKTRAEVLRAAEIGKDDHANPIDIVERDDYNGCSLGSNGMTSVRFYFDGANTLTAIQVWRNYSGQETELIAERKF